MRWQYFNEGNLNILFHRGDQLLRLPKTSTDNTNQQIYHDLSHFPYLAKYLPNIKLVRCPKEWHELDPRVKRDPYGLVMDNLILDTTFSIKVSHHIHVHYNSDKDKCVVEFKPKWLYQCDTLNCRNCCLLAKKQKPKFRCPLSLLNVDDRSRWCHDVFETLPELRWADSKLLTALSEDDIIGILYREQAVDDIHSDILALREVSVSLRKRMTLRDITIFITLNKDSHEYHVRVTDLDLKPVSKLQYWKDVECGLRGLYNDNIGSQCCKEIDLYN